MQHVQLQHEGECFYFIANYHALTTIHDHALLQDLTINVALDYLALGLDPEVCALFRQSDVPEVTELAWILSTVTRKGLLERSHAYKDKIAKCVRPSMGLFNYPLLMAADILIFRANLVPVGRDQLQHIEMAQDISVHFNHAFKCSVLCRPEARLGDVSVVPGTDGQKMSKSYDNCIEIFADPKIVRQRIRSIRTDSSGVDQPKNPDQCPAFALLKLLASTDETATWSNRYRQGGLRYIEVKERIMELFDQTFKDARERRRALAAKPGIALDVLAGGARRARAEAQATMKLVREVCGIQAVRFSSANRPARHSDNLIDP